MSRLHLFFPAIKLASSVVGDGRTCTASLTAFQLNYPCKERTIVKSKLIYVPVVIYSTTRASCYLLDSLHCYCRHSAIPSTAPWFAAQSACPLKLGNEYSTLFLVDKIQNAMFILAFGSNLYGDYMSLAQIPILVSQNISVWEFQEVPGDQDYQPRNCEER